MSRLVQARLDARAEEDLRVLLNEGHNDSDAVRLALREAAERRRRKSALRLAPPLVIDETDIDTALGMIDTCLGEIA